MSPNYQVCGLSSLCISPWYEPPAGTSGALPASADCRGGFKIFADMRVLY